MNLRIFDHDVGMNILITELKLFGETRGSQGIFIT